MHPSNFSTFPTVQPHFEAFIKHWPLLSCLLWMSNTYLRLHHLVDFYVSDPITDEFREIINQLQPTHTKLLPERCCVTQSIQWILVLASCSGLQKRIYHKITGAKFADHHNFIKHFCNHCLIRASQEFHEGNKAGFVLMLQVEKLGQGVNYLPNSLWLGRGRIPRTMFPAHHTPQKKFF